ncbi:MAG: GAF domain-containing protein [Acidobacteriia bacterium]|nr:GAF domain-containing protein [Terriglobia bacterium]
MPDPVAGAPNGERRRCVRQKLHTPVYASFNGPQTGMVVDLSELLDLHEEGFAVQTSERLETNRAVTLCLDLPETRSFIHGTGEVIWSDDSGRGGIRFSALPESAKQVLKEWLFGNLLIGCSNHQARTEQLSRREEEELAEPLPVHQPSTLTTIADRSESPSSLDTVRREVREIGDDFDAVLQSVTERVLSLTGASGAALAFLTDDKMICRARAGEPAPPLGTPVDIQQGISGECVRSGLLVSCDDTENDPRVDPEVGRALGIGSLMASPIVSDFRVVGLLEIFSPHPHRFTNAHARVLDRLVEMIPKTHSGKAQVESPKPETTPGPQAVVEVSQPPPSKVGAMGLDSLHATREALWEDEPDAIDQVSGQIPGQVEANEVPEPLPEPAPAARSRLLYRALLGLVLAVVAVVLGYLVGPMIEKRASSQASQRSLVKGAEAASPVSDQSGADHNAPPKSLAELQGLADRGDADAQWQMAVRYHDGDGVPQSDTQAMLWFQLAAEQGNVAAQSAMGSYYWAGRGVPEDLSKAYMWSEIALAGGDKNSKARLEGLASRMTRAQVSVARQRAEAWIHTHSQSAKSEAN